MPVNPVTVLKVIVQERVDDVEGGEEGDQITIVVAVRVKRLVAGCFFGRSSGSQTLL